MKRIVTIAFVVILALAVVGIGILTVQRQTKPVPEYSLAQVVAGLTHNRRAWQGRILRVRGKAVAYETETGLVLLPCRPRFDDCVFALPAATIHLLLVTDTTPTGASDFGVTVSQQGSLFYTAPDGSTGYSSLLVRVQRPLDSTIMNMLRHLPIIGGMLSPQRQQISGRSVLYLIRINGPCRPHSSGSHALCDDATLISE